MKFQFTASQGGWLFCWCSTTFPEIFQFTASQGGWLSEERLTGQVGNFNSQPHKKADSEDWTFYLPLLYFNSQPHKEADPLLTQNRPLHLTFQFTASQGGWPSERIPSENQIQFQFTASQGGWLLQSIPPWRQKDFNSQPHKEADW